MFILQYFTTIYIDARMSTHETLRIRRNEKMKSESCVIRPPRRCDGEKVGDDIKEADKRRRRRRRRTKSKKNICGDIPLRRKMTQGVAFEDDDVVGPHHYITGADEKSILFPPEEKHVYE